MSGNSQTAPWGFTVPGRPPTPSEGAAFQYSRTGPRGNQRVRTFDNGTCLEFGPEDPVDEFDPDIHPFLNQIALVDSAIRDCRSARSRYEGQPRESVNQNGEKVTELDPFDNFRTHQPGAAYLSTTNVAGQDYRQVESRYASCGNLVSIWAQRNKSDVEGLKHPGSADPRWANGGCRCELRGGHACRGGHVPRGIHGGRGGHEGRGGRGRRGGRGGYGGGRGGRRAAEAAFQSASNCPASAGPSNNSYSSQNESDPFAFLSTISVVSTPSYGRASTGPSNNFYSSQSEGNGFAAIYGPAAGPSNNFYSSQSEGNGFAAIYNPAAEVAVQSTGNCLALAGSSNNFYSTQSGVDHFSHEGLRAAEAASQSASSGSDTGPSTNFYSSQSGSDSLAPISTNLANLTMTSGREPANPQPSVSSTLHPRRPTVTRSLINLGAVKYSQMDDDELLNSTDEQTRLQVTDLQARARAQNTRERVETKQMLQETGRLRPRSMFEIGAEESTTQVSGNHFSARKDDELTELLRPTGINNQSASAANSRPVTRSGSRQSSSTRNDGSSRAKRWYN